MSTTPGTWASSAATPNMNLPEAVTRTLPLSRPKTSTPSSNEPRMPIRSTLIPEVLWRPAGAGVPPVDRFYASGVRVVTAPAQLRNEAAVA